MLCDLETPLMITVWFLSSEGKAVQWIHVFFRRKSAFHIFHQIRLKRCARRHTSPRARSSSSVYIIPVGLLGELMITAFVFSVTAFSSCSGEILKLFSFKAFHKHRFAACKLDLFRVADPVWSRNNHFIPFVKEHLK